MVARREKLGERKTLTGLQKDNPVRGAKNLQPETEEAAFENGRSIK
jgi:hypothetical protein